MHNLPSSHIKNKYSTVHDETGNLLLGQQSNSNSHTHLINFMKICLDLDTTSGAFIRMSHLELNIFFCRSLCKPGQQC